MAVVSEPKSSHRQGRQKAENGYSEGASEKPSSSIIERRRFEPSDPAAFQVPRLNAHDPARAYVENASAMARKTPNGPVQGMASTASGLSQQEHGQVQQRRCACRPPLTVRRPFPSVKRIPESNHPPRVRRDRADGRVGRERARDQRRAGPSSKPTPVSQHVVLAGDLHALRSGLRARAPDDHRRRCVHAPDAGRIVNMMTRIPIV